MYIPAHFAASDDVAQDLLTNCGAADLITSTPGGLLATFLPLVFEPDAGEHGALLGHVARKNSQWRTPVLSDALVVVHGPDAYVSPSWYATTAEHGRVVPTWNYVTAHVYGELVVHDDPIWVERLVRRLTERHEAASERPWSVDDAPPRYISRELRAIVGLEIRIKRIEAKAKLSQNRSEADIQGVIDGLEARGDLRSAAAVRSASTDAAAGSGLQATEPAGVKDQGRDPGVRVELVHAQQDDVVIAGRDFPVDAAIQPGI